MKKISLLSLAGLGITMSAFSQERPNVIFILADDMGSADLGFLGSPIKTPNLDKLRSEGMFLSRSYVQPQSSPSRAALMTGCYPYRLGLHEHIVVPACHIGIPDSVKTIAEKMQDCGYQTAMVGKWHVGGGRRSYLPDNQGFEKTFVGIEGSMNYWNYTYNGKYNIVENGTKYYPKSPKGDESSGNTHVTELFVEKAGDIIHQRSKDKPLFLYLAFTSPHHPLLPPERIVRKYQNSQIDEYWSGKNAKLGRTRNSRIDYMAMVDHMDEQIGRLMEILKKEKMLDNTLIVFCSDNGGIIEGDNRPYRGYKGDSYEGGVRSSTVVWYPRMIAPNSTSDELFYIADWYPTLAELAGENCEHDNIDGISGLSILKGKKGKRNAVPIVSCARQAYITKDYSLVGTCGDYQEMLNTDFSRFDLFDLQNDVSQKHPLEDNELLKNELKAGLEKHIKQVVRGEFNWTIRYSELGGGFGKNTTADHAYDFALDDMPAVNHTCKTVVVSPVIDQFEYKLLGVKKDGVKIELDKYVCRKNAEKYVFDVDNSFDSYQVLTDYHNGLPIYEDFTFNYHFANGLGLFKDNCLREHKMVSRHDGFAPYIDVVNSQNVSIVNENLVVSESSNTPKGMLKLKKKSNTEVETSYTNYFSHPMSKGRFFVSMNVRLNSKETECCGRINFLQLNDARTKVAHTLTLERDGIYDNEKRIAPYKEGDIVKLVYAYELSGTSQDKLFLYVNPTQGSDTPVAVSEGEFTFDRLQFMVDGRESAQLYVDDLKVAKSFKEILSN